MTPMRRRLDDGHPLATWDDLCLALGGAPTSFTGHLLDLCAKANVTQDNLRRLALGFPRQLAAYRLWLERGGTGLTAGDLYDHLDMIKDA